MNSSNIGNKKQDIRNKISSFTKLITWQKGHELVLQIYILTKTFPDTEKYGLTSQMRRCAISITSNIAEGFGRRTMKDRIGFFYISQGSLIELKNQLLVARDVGYLSKEDFSKLANQANDTHRLLQGLITKSKTFLK